MKKIVLKLNIFKMLLKNNVNDLFETEVWNFMCENLKMNLDRYIYMEIIPEINDIIEEKYI